MTRNNVALDQAWTQYFATKDVAARDYILKAYTPLVERIAREIMRKKPSNFDKEDLVQAGMIGLLSALERFDPERKVLFSTFAPLRVKGAIFDEINTMDWTPRLVRERIKLVLRATEEHYRESQHAPSEDEISDILKEMKGKELTPEQVEQARFQATRTYIHAVDHSMILEHEERQPPLASSAAIQKNNLEETVQTAETSRRVIRAMRAVCTSDEIRILHGVFYEEKTMRAIAAEMGIPAARVSHTKKWALEKILEALTGDGFDD